ncbi:hypothetical protein DLM_0007 [Aquitalea magnusonii]|jgi:hypothetical protein|uniref:Uncharacterized protein n=1 Tax=Aquitalea magnusonii TaxID=332411 RepID=A0A3G9G7W1_9NEIS|nr:DUF2802 domain-containing protein [Aquitalea magnusonii]BBF83695.1 hypothetical protein DLM_0007 [Aquitalea magnusonii]
MSGSPFFYIVILLQLALSVACGYLYWRLSRLEHRRDSLTTMYLDQQQQQISSLQRDLARLTARLEQQARSEPVSLSPYNQAIEMIKQGIPASEVASQCGISRSEAELIISLYRNNSTS